MNRNLEQLCEQIQSKITQLLIDNQLSFFKDYKIKVKNLTNTKHLACYRGGSSFSSNPIMWINEDFYAIVEEHYITTTYNENEEDIHLEVLKELEKTIIHELGHALADTLRFCGRRFKQEMNNKEINEWISDEEDFAEDFIQILQSYQVVNQPYFKFYNECINQLSIENHI